ncbi:MAG TPA: hypothetical protein VG125_28415 [Pirellulales bacterium]|jgi:hypothetical protein|nr:hypothetical protein [Pirellulales bacterium]
MSRRFQNILVIVIVFGLPCLGLVVDGCFGFPFTKDLIRNGVAYVKDSVLAPLGLP